MSLLEAMACKVPVMATQACNFPEVTTRQAGWECQCNRESVSETLVNVLREDDLARQQRGRNGHRLVAERYSWSAIVSTILEAGWLLIQAGAQIAWALISKYIIDPMKDMYDRMSKQIGELVSWLSEKWEMVKLATQIAWALCKQYIIQFVSVNIKNIIVFG